MPRPAKSPNRHSGAISIYGQVSNATACTLRDTLLPKLLNGEIQTSI